MKRQAGWVALTLNATQSGNAGERDDGFRLLPRPAPAVSAEKAALAGPEAQMFKKMRVTASEFQKEYGKYSSLAKRQAVMITNHGRDELVVLDAQEYERLQRLDERVAMPVEALSEGDLDRLEEGSAIPEHTKELDHLVPKGW
jgi:PHD/YefM family antitoxin component YafN of YafNO toxin-antitoxin module